jgi:serine/threonine protein kinase
MTKKRTAVVPEDMYRAKTFVDEKDPSVFVKKSSIFRVAEDPVLYCGQKRFITFINYESINEVVALRRLAECGVPYIVRVFDSTVDFGDDSIVLRMERLVPIDVKNLSPDEVQKYIRQLFECLFAMHRAGVYHRDIKLDNLMIDPKSGDLRVIDFGLAVLDPMLTAPHYEKVYTKTFRAPELLLHKARWSIEKTEVWAAGVCALSLILKEKYLFIGEHWHDYLTTIIDAFGVNWPGSWLGLPRWFSYTEECSISGKTQTYWKWPDYTPFEMIGLEYDKCTRDFMKRCLCLDDSTRATTAELLRHPFMSSSFSTTKTTAERIRELDTMFPKHVEVFLEETSMVSERTLRVYWSRFDDPTPSPKYSWLFVTDKLASRFPELLADREDQVIAAALALVLSTRGNLMSLSKTLVEPKDVLAMPLCDIIAQMYRMKFPLILDILTTKYMVVSSYS